MLRQRSLASLLLFWPAVAAAGGSESLELEWRAPPGCPERAEVTAEVERLLGPAPPTGRHLAVRALVAAIDHENYSLSLQTVLDGVSGERTFTASSCRTVTDAAVLTMALALNPDLKWPSVAPVVAPSEPPVPRVAPTSSGLPSLAGASDPSDHDAGRPRIQVLARTLFGMRVGSLPQASPELGIGLGASGAKAALWLFASYSPPVHAEHAKLWMLSSSAIACYALVADVGPCGGVGIDGVRGRGENIAHYRPDSVSWFSAIAGLTAAFRLQHRWRLRLDGQGLVPLRRPWASVEGLGQVYRPSSAAFRAFLGLEMTIP